MNGVGHDAVVGAPIAGIHPVPRGVWVCFRKPGDALSAPIFLDGDDYALLKECTSLLPAQTHAERLASGGDHRRLVPPNARARRAHGGTVSGMSHGSAATNRTRRLSNDRAEARVRLLAARGCFLSRAEIIANLRSGGAPQDDGSSSRLVTVVVRHLSPQVRSRFVSFLANAGIEESTARFALRGGTGAPGVGADRNLSLLLTAGHRAILTDEASTTAVSRREPSEPGVMLHGSFDPCDYSWEDRQETSAQPADEQQLGQAITEVLGRQLGVVVANCGGRVEINSNLTPPALDSLTTFGPSLRIAAVIPGFHCTRMPLPSWLRTIGRSAQAGLPPAEYLREGQGRCVRRTSGMVVSLGTFFDGGCFGFDNRLLSVPFLPDFEDCDDLFGAMLRLSAPDTCTAHVPEVAIDGQGGAGSPNLSSVLTQVRPGMGRLIGDVLARTQLGPRLGNVDDWCGYTGAVLEAVANGSREDVLELAYECAHSYWFTAHQQIADLLDGSGRPSNRVSQALVAVRDELRRLLATPSEAVPGAHRGAVDRVHAIDAARVCMRNFARLLQAWPAMWTAAARLTDGERDVLAGRCG